MDKSINGHQKTRKNVLIGTIHLCQKSNVPVVPRFYSGFFFQIVHLKSMKQTLIPNIAHHYYDVNIGNSMTVTVGLSLE